MGSETLRSWRPSKEEVDSIIAEMRPIIAELARHQALVPDLPVKKSGQHHR
jgi:hypothetical protein